MRIYRIDFIILVFFFTSSASFGQVSTKVSNYVFNLPETTGYYVEFNYVNDLADEYIRVCNEPTPVIEVYSLKTGDLTCSIRPDVSELGSVLKVDGDNFWIFDTYKRQLQLINSDGKVLVRRNEMETTPKNGLSAFFGNSQGSPLILHDAKVFTVFSFLDNPDTNPKADGFLNQGIIRVFDTKKNEFSWIGGLTPKIKRYSYGQLHRYSCIKAKHYIIVSSCFSMEKAVYDLKKNVFFYSHIRDTIYQDLIKPFASWERNWWNVKRTIDDEKVSRHFIDNPRFSYILYDEFRDIFYQFVYFPQTKTTRGKTEVLVLDNTLEFKKKYIFDDKYTTLGAFVTKDGLSMLNRDQYNKDDSKLVFDTFSF